MHTYYERTKAPDRTHALKQRHKNNMFLEYPGNVNAMQCWMLASLDWLLFFRLIRPH